MNDETQTGNKQDLEGVPPPLPAAAGNPSAMRGTTVGTLDDAATGSRPDTIRHSVQGQAIAGALFILALLPAILLCLDLGLTNRAHLIPSSQVWAWAATAAALVAAVQGTVRAVLRPGLALAWVQPALIALLLVAPSVTVLYLRQTVHTATTPLVFAQIVLYAIAVVVLLMSALSSAAKE